MSFHVLYFIKGNDYREIWVSDKGYKIGYKNNIFPIYEPIYEVSYKIVTKNSPYGGKYHKGSPTKYISTMLKNGWNKVDNTTFRKVKYGIIRR